MSLIVVVHGLTGSGKTEVANHLETKHGFYHFHPYRFVKQQYEELLGKPSGFLDTQEGKRYIVPGLEAEGVTMQEMMVEDYHFSRSWFPLRTALNLRRSLPELLQKSDVCCVSLRNIAEITELLEVAANGHELVLIKLSRNEEREESSDVFYLKIRDMLMQAADKIFPVENNFSLSRLYATIDGIVAYCR